MSSNADIFDAFAAAVEQFGQTLAVPVPIAYPNVDFTPPTGIGALWLELAFFPNETANYALGNTSIPRGFAQLTVGARKGFGLMPALELVDLAILYFAKGSTMGPSRIEREPWALSPIQEPNMTLTPITIPYRGDNSA
jgi:hypothetical protein